MYSFPLEHFKYLNGRISCPREWICVSVLINGLETKYYASVFIGLPQLEMISLAVLLRRKIISTVEIFLNYYQVWIFMFTKMLYDIKFVIWVTHRNSQLFSVNLYKWTTFLNLKNCNSDLVKNWWISVCFYVREYVNK